MVRSGYGAQKGARISIETNKLSWPLRTKVHFRCSVMAVTGRLEEEMVQVVVSTYVARGGDTGECFPSYPTLRIWLNFLPRKAQPWDDPASD
jgi:hypothetical protein